jgi:indolepyruvate ferredoxin oxidoreductase beta subunit
MNHAGKDPINIIICGVGGQGNILASELLASALVEKGYFITVGETYGASQRGGSVMSHVRISARRSYGALIPLGEADVIVGFEPIETLRVVRDYGHAQTKVIFDPRPNYPLGVLIGESVYPSIAEIEEELKSRCQSVVKLEATSMAQAAGNSQAANILLMGALTALDEVPLQADDYDEILQQRFQGEILEMNRTVFRQGYGLIGNSKGGGWHGRTG